VTLEKPDLVRPLRTVTKPRKAPVVLSQEEVARLLQAAPSVKYKAALSVAYGAGLRVSEVANLKVSDIDSGRMMLRVEQGKGQRDRDVSRPRSSNPHSRARPNSPKPPRGFLLGRLSSAGPDTGPTVAKGRRPKPFTFSDYQRHRRRQRLRRPSTKTSARRSAVFRQSGVS
jgi:integrase